jgi:hypothetical protein
MDFTLVFAVAGGLVAGIVVALKIIAPLTKTTVDDQALAIAEKIKALADALNKQ